MPDRVPLHDVHEELGARFTEFAGYEMPVMYESIVDEHEAVRKAVGVFDVSHMGNLWIQGGAAETLARCTAADARDVPEGRAKYTVVLRDDGTILDDTIFSHTSQGFHLVPNAGRDEDVAAWLEDHGGDVDNVTDETSILAVQGPEATDVVVELAPEATDLGKFDVDFVEIDGVRAMVSRTGYTGEDGFEAIVEAAGAERVYHRILGEGATPCGLGARDTLRLEMGFPLAGHEFAGGRTPVEAGLSWLIEWDHDFLGKKTLQDQREHGTDETLVGLVLEEGIPRQGYEVQIDGERVGEVTSGTKGPTVGHGIALAYVDVAYREPGTAVEVQVRGTAQQAEVVDPPFLERG